MKNSFLAGFDWMSRITFQGVKLQPPKPKTQRNPNFQVPMRAAWVLRLGVSLVLGVWGLKFPATAAEPTASQNEFFEKRVRPVLVENCVKCHGAEKQKGGLRLDSREAILKGGDDGSVIVVGKPDESMLIKAVRHTGDLKMPRRDKTAEKLSPEKIEALTEWVKMGAPWPEEVQSPKSKLQGHWAYLPVAKSTIPAVKDKRWPKNEVDHFILAALEAKKLKPARDADRRTLIRRATYDLIGLPPTPEEVAVFLADKSPNAFEKVVDRLLASPHYGEQWGRHWLDVVRYADTAGCNSDYPVPTAYKYRNYVIESFNRDKPYDQFLREQLAGDLLPNATDAERFEKIIATGYLAISRRFGSRASEFHQTIEDTIDNAGKTMLGLSVSCARCHDHKFDPISIRDYYALYGIFNSTRYAFPGTEIYKHPKDFVPLAPAKEAEEYYKNAEELALLDDTIEKLGDEKRKFERLEEAAKKAQAQDNDGALQVERKDRLKLPVFNSLVEVKAALEDARTEQRKLEIKEYKFEKAFAVAEGQVGDVAIQKKGNPRESGEIVPRGFLQILGGQKLPPNAKGSGRVELAQWITDPKNPLTARVMVNRIWQHHFGKGIVQTPNDFGVRGRPPTHPKLLDTLAARFIESGWSVKAMHRLIMLSRVYQIASEDSPTSAVADPNNDLLWKFTRRRLSAEEVRDSLLYLSGGLDPTMGGPHPFPPENEWKYTQHKPFVALYPTNRRSVYLMQQRIRKHPFLEMFDGADTNATTAVRSVSVTPLQALFMMNDPFVHEQADQFAVRVGMAFTDDPQRIRHAYELVFARLPTADEIRAGQEYLRQCRLELAKTKVPADQQPRVALDSYMRVLLSSNEFMFVE